MRQYKRSKRVAQLLREEISKIITQDLKDPLIGMATVTTIKLTDDLKSARVFVSIIGDNDAIKKSLRGLERAKNWIRSELGQRTDLKYVPRLEFYYDDTIDHAQNIESLIKQIHNN